MPGAVLDHVYYSSDGGKTWKKDKLESTFGVYGDPVIRADYDGNFYFAHLSNPTGKAWQDEEFLDRIVVQKSTDNGATWNNGSHTEPNNPKDQDKHWIVIDPRTNDIYMTWTEFDNYGSKASEDKSRIMFSKSTDGGGSWTTPKAISQFEGDCLDDDDTPEGAVPAVGPNGEVYVCWSYNEKLYFDKSLDGGETWMNVDGVVANQPGGWAITIPGIGRCNGMPVTEVDLSNGPNRGTIYVNWSDQLNGEDDTDIWIKKSTDGGVTWSDRKRVNGDASGKQQFFTWMDIDPSTGYIYIVYYDRRAYDGYLTDTYLAYSTDGGESFKEMKISEEPFTPNPLVFFGDYNDISAINGSVRPIWTQLNKGKLSIWTALIEHK